VNEVAANTVVDERYRIVDRIGSGGMADVYRAEDIHLGREIALKVLHRRFAQDEEFVERFRREARAAAGLAHPNVVGVYDRGEHEGTYYIAMEHLTGSSLKEVVQSEAPLDQERVIDLGVAILQAAAFAHKHGVIHRDFKPHNVIVDAEGVPKVTDFGIARAGASEMTETGSIMGTAQYLSPEQAQGHSVTAASDLYSIGIMLYELLTGRLPFAGDSAVSIALKHLSEIPPPMSDDGRDPARTPDAANRLRIEPNLEAVVMGALAKDPAARWQSAEDFAEALEACRPYVQAHGNGVAPGGPAAGAVPAPVVVAGPAAEVERVEEGESRRRRRWPYAALAVLVLALVAVMAYAFTRPDKFEVPKVEGIQLSEARERLDRAGFEEVDVDRARSRAPLDTVIGQEPDAGEKAPREEPVSLTVSSGPGKVRMPSVRNQPRERAIKELNKVGLEVTEEPEASETVKEGLAIRTVPGAGTEVDRNSRVQLFVSTGPEQVAVPDVVGLTRESAEARITDVGLEVAVQTAESDEAEEGEVLAQSPDSGTLERGETVTITVATAPEQISVPDVTGLSRSEALRVLRNAGLAGSVQEEATDDPAEDGTVLEQRPGAAVEVDEGSSVTIVVGLLEELESEPEPGGAEPGEPRAPGMPGEPQPLP